MHLTVIVTGRRKSSKLRFIRVHVCGFRAVTARHQERSQTIMNSETKSRAARVYIVQQQVTDRIWWVVGGLPHSAIRLSVVAGGAGAGVLCPLVHNSTLTEGLLQRSPRLCRIHIPCNTVQADVCILAAEDEVTADVPGHCVRKWKCHVGLAAAVPHVAKRHVLDGSGVRRSVAVVAAVAACCDLEIPTGGLWICCERMSAWIIYCIQCRIDLYYIYRK